MDAGTGALASPTGAGGGAGVVSGGFTGEATGAVVDSDAATSTTVEHCLHRIFLPTRFGATLVCHWQEGHLTGILAPPEASGTCPMTMGAAGFLTSPKGAVAGLERGVGGGVSWEVELAAEAGDGV